MASHQDTSPNNTLVTNLFNSLASTAAPQHTTSSSAEPQTTTNSLKDISAETTSQLLVLHAFFPNEFLPALDLLDRQLVTRFIPDFIENDVQQHPKSTLYFVLSASSHPDPVDANQTSPGRRRSGSHTGNKSRSSYGRGRFYNPLSTGSETQYYEIRTQSWNCSCPAFAFSAFPAFISFNSDLAAYSENRNMGNDDNEWRWGGISRPRIEDDVAPVCKHLLACVLGERITSLFGQQIKEKVVGPEELASWVAGMGSFNESS